MSAHQGKNNGQTDTLEGLRRGDSAACEQVALWARRAITLPRFRVAPDDVEDLVQDTLVQMLALVHKPGFTIHTSLQALVRRIAMARVIDRIRRARPQTTLPPNLPATVEDPIEKLAFQQEAERLRQAIAELKELCRDLIHRFYFKNQPYRTISEQTGRNANTLRVHMFNCLQALRRTLGM